MSQGVFLPKSPSDAREFLEDLVKKTMQWETIRDDSLNFGYSGAMEGMHAVSDLSHLEFRFAALENMMKGLVL